MDGGEKGRQSDVIRYKVNKVTYWRKHHFVQDVDDAVAGFFVDVVDVDVDTLGSVHVVGEHVDSERTSLYCGHHKLILQLRREDVARQDVELEEIRQLGDVC